MKGMEKDKPRGETKSERTNDACQQCIDPDNDEMNG